MKYVKIRQDLEDITFELGLYENAILLEIAKRLRLGQSQYGQFTNEKLKHGKWLKEASEEIADCLVYMGARTLVDQFKE